MNLALLHEVTEEFAAYLSEVTDGDLTAPTPCAGWTIQDLVAHLLDTTTELATALDPQAKPPAPDGRYAPRETTYRDAAHSAAEALASARAAADGRLSPDDRFESHLANTLIHTWDLAEALELDFDRPHREAIDIARRYLHRLPPESHGPGQPFADRLATPPVPSMDEVLALSGRDPKWTPSN